MKKIAFLFPGQGAQYPGMAKDFYENFPIAKHTFDEADAFLGKPFSKLIFEGPAEELTLTKNSQIAIYIASMAILRTVQERFYDLIPVCCAGLSLGEYTALTAARKISFSDGLDLVRTRAEAMHRASVENAGTMHVVLGLNQKLVQEALDTIGQSVWIANLNCPGQVVIAGTHEGVAYAGDVLRQKGAKRILPLDVSGAFHTPLMRSAQEALAVKMTSVDFCESGVDIAMNVPGAIVHAEMKQYLIDQVVSPVLWEKEVLAMQAHGVQSYIEMGPGKTLCGMNKRIGVVEPSISIETVKDLEQLESYAVIEK